MNEKNVEVKINENDIVPAQVIKVNNKTITLKTKTMRLLRLIDQKVLSKINSS